MIFHENRLLADDSHVISNLIFCRKLGKLSQNLSSAAVVIGALRVSVCFCLCKSVISSSSQVKGTFQPKRVKFTNSVIFVSHPQFSM